MVTEELNSENIRLVHKVMEYLRDKEMIARDKIVWQKDDFCGYEVPVHIPDIDLGRFDLSHYYSEEQIQEMSGDFKQERLEWLSRFKHLDRGIIEALKP